MRTTIHAASPLLAALFAALLACAPANRVDGFVGDQQLSIASAHLTWLPGALGDDDR